LVGHRIYVISYAHERSDVLDDFAISLIAGTSFDEFTRALDSEPVVKSHRAG